MRLIESYSKLSKEEKIDFIAKSYFKENPGEAKQTIKDFWHKDTDLQQTLDEFSENTITNFYLPYGTVPNLLVNNKLYTVPLAIEESSVVAACSKSAKFWATRGGVHAEVIATEKIGQVHFIWHGCKEKLKIFFEGIKNDLILGSAHLLKNMEIRGGGLIELKLIDKTMKMPGYYQIWATFNTCNAMGANFINSVLENFALDFKQKISLDHSFVGTDKDVHIVMSILSNYTPSCLVRASVECKVSELADKSLNCNAFEFAKNLEAAVQISKVDVHRAVTHNKGIFNGIDAVTMSTGNDSRAVEACGHAYASRSGTYRGLTDIELIDGRFKLSIDLPLSIGTVGGLTQLHPMAKLSLKMLGNPNVQELMQIILSIGLMQNFGALRSLVTTGIQKGHMKMHLMNILNHLNASEDEKQIIKSNFINKTVSFNAVREELVRIRNINKCSE